MGPQPSRGSVCFYGHLKLDIEFIQWQNILCVPKFTAVPFAGKILHSIFVRKKNCVHFQNKKSKENVPLAMVVLG